MLAVSLDGRLMVSLVLQQPSSRVFQTAEMGTRPHQVRACPFSLFSLRFPLLGWRRTKPNELIIGQPLANNPINHRLEAVSIVSLSSVEAESLFVKIANQVERFNIDVSSFDCSLQETPEVFNAIGVNMSFDISLSMVNDFMDILSIQVIIGRQSISDKIATCFNGLPDCWGIVLRLVSASILV